MRTIELRAALWQEFDLDNAIWEIPAKRMKMCGSHLVQLLTQALNLLHELKAMTGNYRYVFPGRNDPNKPMSEASVNQLIKRIGYAGRLTSHGFRHNFSTILHDHDFDTAWTELQLAHVEKKSNQRYLYVSMVEKMMQWYSDFIFKG